MKDKNVIKKIIIGLGVAVLLLGLYAIFVPSQDSTGGASSLTSAFNSGVLGQVEESDITLANSEILRVLGSIQNISLDDQIFSNPTFDLLKDSRFTIPNPAKIGRANPFLPSGFDAIAAAQQQGGTEVVTQDSGFFSAPNPDTESPEESGSFEVTPAL